MFGHGLKGATAPLISYPVVTDLTVCISTPSTEIPTSGVWHPIRKGLHLPGLTQRAWLYVALANEKELVDEDLLVTDIRVGESQPDLCSDGLWHSRPGGIWLRRRKFSGKIEQVQVVTGIDVLFGEDAVDPRPQWNLMQSPLRLENVPVARLSVLRGRVKPSLGNRTELRTRGNGIFKIVQISDTHMGTGVGTCDDAIDAHGELLPKSAADPLTVEFVGQVLDTEKPDLVVLTGDQLHHDITDSQSALFKVVNPIIVRSIPFAAVFGNHDSEGIHALSRE